ncbi:MAG: hypothetical protein JTT11_03005 [Candidatus Brockarchaeota archaeon]|nr:hypothetical protein [Candidatus Brockarchaeota archaeon]
MKRGKAAPIILLSCLSLTFMMSIVSADPDHWPGSQLWVDNNGPIDRIDVLPGITYDVQVYLPDWPADSALIKVSDPYSSWQQVDIDQSYWSESFYWTCPLDSTFCTTFVVQVKQPEGGETYIIEGVLEKNAHFHVVPEFVFGTGMSVTMLIGSLVAFSIFKKRKNQKQCLTSS